MIELTVAQLFGIVVFTALVGGTSAVLGPKFLAWTDKRRLDKAEQVVLDTFPGATRIPEQRQGRS